MASVLKVDKITLPNDTEILNPTTGTLNDVNGYSMLKGDCVVLGPNAGTTYAAGSTVTNWQVHQQHGTSLTASSSGVTVNKAGSYFIMASLLCNTGTSGSTGDGRIRVNSSSIVATYAHAADTGNWEKSVGACAVYCNVGDFIDYYNQDANHIWGTTNPNGYTHSPFTIIKIGD